MRAHRLFILNLLAFSFCIALVTVGSAGVKGNETKGKFYFKQNCKTCHTKGAAGGEITPLNKKMTQWTNYFQSGKHNHGKEPLTQYVSDEQLRDVQTFLTNHAADSLQPKPAVRNSASFDRNGGESYESAQIPQCRCRECGHRCRGIVGVMLRAVREEARAGRFAH